MEITLVPKKNFWILLLAFLGQTTKFLARQQKSQAVWAHNKTNYNFILSIVTETSRDSPDRPPNSAPLPAKFASSLGHSEKPNSQHAGAVVLPHNLLRLQLQKKSLIDCDTSSAGIFGS